MCKACLKDVATVTFYCMVCGHVFLNSINESCLCAKINHFIERVAINSFIMHKFPELPKAGDKRSYENL